MEPIEHVNDLLKGTHEIRGSYRGWIMYLYPNARFTRSSSNSCGINGFAGCPTVGHQEEVLLRVNDETYTVLIEFV
jgi:hypothetical protein